MDVEEEIRLLQRRMQGVEEAYTQAYEVIEGHEACLQRVERDDRQKLAEFKAIKEARLQLGEAAGLKSAADARLSEMRGRLADINDKIDALTREAHYKMSEHSKQIHFAQQRDEDRAKLLAELIVRLGKVERASVRNLLAMALTAAGAALSSAGYRVRK